MYTSLTSASEWKSDAVRSFCLSLNEVNAPGPGVYTSSMVLNIVRSSWLSQKENDEYDNFSTICRINGRWLGSSFQQSRMRFHVLSSMLGLCNRSERSPLVTSRMIWYSCFPLKGTVSKNICVRHLLNVLCRLKNIGNIQHNKGNQKHTHQSSSSYHLRCPRKVPQTVQEQHNWTDNLSQTVWQSYQYIGSIRYQWSDSGDQSRGRCFPIGRKNELVDEVRYQNTHSP